MLHNIYSKYASDVTYTGTDKNTCHSYLDTYEQLFNPLQTQSINLLEIGVSGGYSIQMWLEYFDKAHIYAVDVAWWVCKFLFPRDRVTCITGDATKEETFQQITALDVVIDDGSHYPQDQLASFKLLYPKLRANGLYIIEDIQDVDSFIPELDKLTTNYVVNDLRKIKNRTDDVLVVAYKC